MGTFYFQKEWRNSLSFYGYTVHVACFTWCWNQCLHSPQMSLFTWQQWHPDHGLNANVYVSMAQGQNGSWAKFKFSLQVTVTVLCRHTPIKFSGNGTAWSSCGLLTDRVPHHYTSGKWPYCGCYMARSGTSLVYQRCGWGGGWCDQTEHLELEGQHSSPWWPACCFPVLSEADGGPRCWSCLQRLWLGPLRALCGTSTGHTSAWLECPLLKHLCGRSARSCKSTKWKIARSVHFRLRMNILYSAMSMSILSTHPMNSLYTFTTSGRVTSMCCLLAALQRRTRSSSVLPK